MLANLDFEEVGSLAKAKAVVSAARAWMILRPESASDQSSSLQMGKEFVAEILISARRYVAANSAGATATTGTRFLSVTDGFR